MLEYGFSVRIKDAGQEKPYSGVFYVEFVMGETNVISFYCCYYYYYYYYFFFFLIFKGMYYQYLYVHLITLYYLHNKLN